MCELEELISGKQGDAFVELPMQGGLAPPEVIVIERRQIVVDQGKEVNEFDRTGKDRGGIRRKSEPGGRFVCQAWPKPFSRAFQGVEDGVPEPGARTLAEHEALNQVPVEAFLRKHEPKLTSFGWCFNHNH